MNREERRRAERAARRNGRGQELGPSFQAPAGRIARAAVFSPADEERQRQDFLAGGVFADGAGVMFPEGYGPGLSPVFVVYVHDDERTFGPAPQLRTAFDLLDEVGSVALHERMPVATSWSGMSGSSPLVKLKLGFPGPRPARGSADLVLLADQYAELWQYIVGGGLIGVTTQQRLEKATSHPGASFTDGLEACVLLGIGSSPVLEQLMHLYRWPQPTSAV
ncbi:hypothetical protein [Kitasatospora sp. NPDC018614]|uniref:hypothetical protein n=1 Tax=Kitasatospora sp. NPDC018614 TaxID=3364026 RepID=UPI0037B6BB02